MPRIVAAMTVPITKLKAVLSKNVKTRRKALGLSQEQLALEAEIDRTYVSQIERMIANPSLLALHKIAQRLNTEITSLFDEPQRSSQSGPEKR